MAADSKAMDDDMIEEEDDLDVRSAAPQPLPNEPREPIRPAPPLIIDKTQSVGSAMCLVGFWQYNEEIQGELSPEQQKLLDYAGLRRGVARKSVLLDLNSIVGQVFGNGDTLQYVVVPQSYKPGRKLRYEDFFFRRRSRFY